MPYKTKRRPSVSRRLKIVSIICAALALMLVLVSLTMQRQEVLEANAEAARSFTPQPIAPPTKRTLTVADFEAAAAKLRDSTEPFTLTVIGDSTSSPIQGWVEVIAEDIAEISGRTAVVHPWNIETGAYDEPHSYGEGEPALTIWNGSAPGRDAEYSMSNLARMIPEQPDMVIINHGHNGNSIESVRSLAFQVADLTKGDAALAITKQNLRSDDRTEIHAEKMETLAGIVSKMPGVPFIDAQSAFTENTASLLVDGVHPTQPGYRGWADVVMRVLGF